MPLTAEDHTSTGAPGRLEELFRAHHDHLVRLAMVMSGDASLAEDVAQEAFVRLGRARRWPSEGAELAYLRRTVVNLVHGHHRHLAVRRKHVLRVVSDTTDHTDPAGDAVRGDLRREVVAQVRALPRRQMDCVVLRYYAQLTDGEIAETLDIDVGSVKTHLHRARRTLATALEELR